MLRSELSKAGRTISVWMEGMHTGCAAGWRFRNTCGPDVSQSRLLRRFICHRILNDQAMIDKREKKIQKRWKRWKECKMQWEKRNDILSYIPRLWQLMRSQDWIEAGSAVFTVGLICHHFSSTPWTAQVCGPTYSTYDMIYNTVISPHP